MRWLDTKGRLGGVLSLVDLAALALLAALLLPLFYFAYSAAGLMEIDVTDVEPTRIVVGENLRLKIRGTGFPQNCRVKLSTVELGPPVLVTDSSLEADIPPDLPPGWHHPIVSGRHRSRAAVSPILAVWRPEIVSVTPETFGVAEEALLEVTGKYFKADIQVFLGGVPLPKVEYVGESLLWVKVPPGTVLPGSHTLRLVNPSFGEKCARDWPITVQGAVQVPLYVVILLEELASEKADYLRRITAGAEPIRNPNTVEFIHVLSKGEIPEEKKKKPKAKKKKRGHEPGVSILTGLGLTGKVEYDGVRFLFTYQDQLLAVGSPVKVRVNGVDIDGAVLVKPIVRELRYREASR